MNLGHFPDELLVLIASYLPIKDLITFSTTSQRFHHISKERFIWKRLFETTFQVDEAKDTDYYSKYRQYINLASSNRIGLSENYSGYINRDGQVTLLRHKHPTTGPQWGGPLYEISAHNAITKVVPFTQNTPPGDAIQISVGSQHFAVIRKEETGNNLYTWGIGRFGRLGHENERDMIDKPTRVYFDLKVQPNIKQVECAGEFTVALTESGHIYTWANAGELVESLRLPMG